MTGQWHSARRVLAIRLDNAGDVIMTSPALRALKRAVPGRHLALLTSPGGAHAGRLVPAVDEVWEYDSPWMKATADRSSSAPDLDLIQRLRAARFDAAVIFAVYSQSPLPAALTCFLADIPLRLAHCRENPYQLLTDWVPEREPEQGVRHEVRRQLDLVAHVGCDVEDERLSLAITHDARERATRWLRDHAIDESRPWGVIHPGASAPSRRYPPEHFVAVTRALVSQHGWQLVFSGDDAEREQVDAIRRAAGVPTASAAGQLPLAVLAALIERAWLLISNNTAPVHVAAGVGTPVVDLYALTNPQHTPWQVPHRLLYRDVPCKYCYRSVCPEGHHDCLRGVAPGEVVAAALELLSETRGAPHHAAAARDQPADAIPGGGERDQ